MMPVTTGRSVRVGLFHGGAAVGGKRLQGGTAMAQVLHMEEWRKLRAARLARLAMERATEDISREKPEGPAQVLLFTGVRYEYLDTDGGELASTAD